MLCGHGHVGARGDIYSVFIKCFPSYCLRHPLPEPRAHWFSYTGGHQAPGSPICLSVQGLRWALCVCIDPGYLNSGPPACGAHTWWLTSISHLKDGLSVHSGSHLVCLVGLSVSYNSTCQSCSSFSGCWSAFQEALVWTDLLKSFSVVSGCQVWHESLLSTLNRFSNRVRYRAWVLVFYLWRSSSPPLPPPTSTHNLLLPATSIHVLKQNESVKSA